MMHHHHRRGVGFLLLVVVVILVVPTTQGLLLLAPPLTSTTTTSTCRRSFTTGSTRLSSSYDNHHDQARATTVILRSTTTSTTTTDTPLDDNDKNDSDNDRPPCYYQPLAATKKGTAATDIQWKPRIPLEDLSIGQALQGYVIQEYLQGKTGPKLFIECGIGHYNDKQCKWSMVFGMLRLSRTKVSVLRKRVQRLKKKSLMDVYVSRIFVESGRFEVVLDPEDVPSSDSDSRMISVSTLTPGQIVEGTVMRVEDYGVLVDVGANRWGLLPIQKVADLYHTYIDKSKGLSEAGLEIGARVRLQVESIQQRRLLLEFTTELQELSQQEWEEKQQAKATLKPLEPGQVVHGIIRRVEDYGVLVDIINDNDGESNNNKKSLQWGLLPIQTVAKLHRQFIDKAKGLTDMGLQVGTPISLQVQSIHNGKHVLEFTKERQAVALQEWNERKQQEQLSKDEQGSTVSTTTITTKDDADDNDNDDDDDTGMSAEELAAWAQYADEDEDDDGDEYDEENDIEDAFGLGMY